MPKTTVPLTEVKPLLPQSKKTLFNKQDIFISYNLSHLCLKVLSLKCQIVARSKRRSLLKVKRVASAECWGQVYFYKGYKMQKSTQYYSLFNQKLS